MSPKTISKLHTLNKTFYECVGNHFSATRNYYWKGWGKLEPTIESILRENKSITVLDLGCGNGRFYGFLKDTLGQNRFEYTGLDISERMLAAAGERYPKGHFQIADVIDPVNLPNKKFDLVVAFGLTHHIPSKKNRLNWFSQMPKLIAPKGALAMSFWEFRKDTRFKKAVENIATTSITIKKPELEEGDFFLGWDRQEGVYRYVHQYSETEYAKIKDLLEKTTLTLETSFHCDGKENKLNLYNIYRKIA
jgi:tRNA (uracil-5-)-methyltransferase TRM9